MKSIIDRIPLLLSPKKLAVAAVCTALVWSAPGLGCYQALARVIRTTPPSPGARAQAGTAGSAVLPVYSLGGASYRLASPSLASSLPTLRPHSLSINEGSAAVPALLIAPAASASPAEYKTRERIAQAPSISAFFKESRPVALPSAKTAQMPAGKAWSFGARLFDRVLGRRPLQDSAAAVKPSSIGQLKGPRLAPSRGGALFAKFAGADEPSLPEIPHDLGLSEAEAEKVSEFTASFHEQVESSYYDYGFTVRDYYAWVRFVRFFTPRYGLKTALSEGALYVYRDRLDTKSERDSFGAMLNSAAAGLSLADPEHGKDAAKAKELLKIAQPPTETVAEDEESPFHFPIAELIPDKAKTDLVTTPTTLQRIRAAYNAFALRDYMLMVGPPATIKSAIPKHLAAQYEIPHLAVTLHPGIGTFELVGGYRPAEVHIRKVANAKRIVRQSLREASETDDYSDLLDAALKVYGTTTIDAAIKLLEKDLAFKPAKGKAGETKNARHDAHEVRRRLMTLAHALRFGTASLTWQDGYLTYALRRDIWITFEELNAAPTEVLEFLNEFMRSKRLVITERLGEPETLSPRPGGRFMLWATMNHETDSNRQVLADTLKNRWRVKSFGPLPPFEQAEIIEEKYGLPQNWALALVENVHSELKRQAVERVIGEEWRDGYSINLRHLFKIAARWKHFVEAAEEENGGPIDEQRKLYYLAREAFSIYGGMMRLDSEKAGVFTMLDQALNLNANGISSADDLRIRPQRIENLGDRIRIGDVELPRGKGGPHVPRINPDYLADETVLERLYEYAKALAMGEPLLLMGETAAGKTSDLEYLFSEPVLNLNLRYKNLDSDSAIEEVIGGYTTGKKRGQYVFQEGLLPHAMEESSGAFLDEFNLNPLVEWLNTVIDDGMLYLPHRIVKGVPYLVAAANPPEPRYEGRILLSPAVRSRWTERWVQKDTDKARLKRLWRHWSEGGMIHAATAAALAVLIFPLSAWLGGPIELSADPQFSSGIMLGAFGMLSTGLPVHNVWERLKRLWSSKKKARPDPDDEELALPQSIEEVLRAKGVPEARWPALIRKAESIKTEMRMTGSAVGRDAGLQWVPGYLWAIFFEQNTVTYPVEHLLTHTREEILGLTAHEAGHREITFLDQRYPLVRKYFQDPIKHLLWNALEDPRVNSRIIHRLPGSRRYFYSAYSRYIPEDLAESYRAAKPAAKKDDLEVPAGDGASVFNAQAMRFPHVEFLMASNYYWRYGKKPPKFLNRSAEEAFDKTREHMDKIFGMYPKESEPDDQTKLAYSLQALRLIDEHVLKHYEPLVQESQKKLSRSKRRRGKGKGKGKPGSGGMPNPDQKNPPPPDKQNQKPSTDGNGAAKPQEQKPDDKKKDGGAAKPQEDKPDDKKKSGGGRKEEDEPSKEDLDKARRKLEKHARDAAERMGGKLKKNATRKDAGLPPKKKDKDKKAGRDRTPSGNEKPKPLTIEDIANTQREQRLNENASPWQRTFRRIAPLAQKMVSRFENIFYENSRPRNVGYFRRGKLIGMQRAMRREGEGGLRDDVWLRRVHNTRRSYKVTILVDESGSMADFLRSALDAVSLVLWSLARLRIDVEIIGFSEKAHVHKRFGLPLTPQLKDKIVAEIEERISHGGGTHDANALQLALDRIVGEEAERKMIFVVTDGAGNGPSNIASVLPEAAKAGVYVMALGIGAGMAYVKEAYPRHAFVEHIRDLPRTLFTELEKYIHDSERTSFTRAARGAGGRLARFALPATFSTAAWLASNKRNPSASPSAGTRKPTLWNQLTSLPWVTILTSLGVMSVYLALALFASLTPLTDMSLVMLTLIGGGIALMLVNIRFGRFTAIVFLPGMLVYLAAASNLSSGLAGAVLFGLFSAALLSIENSARFEPLPRRLRLELSMIAPANNALSRKLLGTRKRRIEALKQLLDFPETEEFLPMLERLARQDPDQKARELAGDNIARLAQVVPEALQVLRDLVDDITVPEAIRGNARQELARIEEEGAIAAAELLEIGAAQDLPEETADLLDAARRLREDLDNAHFVDKMLGESLTRYAEQLQAALAQKNGEAARIAAEKLKDLLHENPAAPSARAQWTTPPIAAFAAMAPPMMGAGFTPQIRHIYGESMGRHFPPDWKSGVAFLAAAAPTFLIGILLNNNFVALYFGVFMAALGTYLVTRTNMSRRGNKPLAEHNERQIRRWYANGPAVRRPAWGGWLNGNQLLSTYDGSRSKALKDLQSAGLERDPELAELLSYLARSETTEHNFELIVSLLGEMGAVDRLDELRTLAPDKFDKAIASARSRALETSALTRERLLLWGEALENLKEPAARTFEALDARDRERFTKALVRMPRIYRRSHKVRIRADQPFRYLTYSIPNARERAWTEVWPLIERLADPAPFAQLLDEIIREHYAAKNFDPVAVEALLRGDYARLALLGEPGRDALIGLLAEDFGERHAASVTAALRESAVRTFFSDEALDKLRALQFDLAAELESLSTVGRLARETETLGREPSRIEPLIRAAEDEIARLAHPAASWIDEERAADLGRRTAKVRAASGENSLAIAVDRLKQALDSDSAPGGSLAGFAGAGFAGASWLGIPTGGRALAGAGPFRKTRRFILPEFLKTEKAKVWLLQLPWLLPAISAIWLGADALYLMAAGFLSLLLYSIASPLTQKWRRLWGRAVEELEQPAARAFESLGTQDRNTFTQALARMPRIYRRSHKMRIRADHPFLYLTYSIPDVRERAWTEVWPLIERLSDPAPLVRLLDEIIRSQAASTSRIDPGLLRPMVRRSEYERLALLGEPGRDALIGLLAEDFGEWHEETVTSALRENVVRTFFSNEALERLRTLRPDLAAEFESLSAAGQLARVAETLGREPSRIELLIRAAEVEIARLSIPEASWLDKERAADLGRRIAKVSAASAASDKDSLAVEVERLKKALQSDSTSRGALAGFAGAGLAGALWLGIPAWGWALVGAGFLAAGLLIWMLGHMRKHPGGWIASALRRPDVRVLLAVPAIEAAIFVGTFLTAATFGTMPLKILAGLLLAAALLTQKDSRLRPLAWLTLISLGVAFLAANQALLIQGLIPYAALIPGLTLFVLWTFVLTSMLFMKIRKWPSIQMRMSYPPPNVRDQIRRSMPRPRFGSPERRWLRQLAGPAESRTYALKEMLAAPKTAKQMLKAVVALAPHETDPAAARQLIELLRVWARAGILNESDLELLSLMSLRAGGPVHRGISEIRAEIRDSKSVVSELLELPAKGVELSSEVREELARAARILERSSETMIEEDHHAALRRHAVKIEAALEADDPDRIRIALKRLKGILAENPAPELTAAAD